MTEEQMQQWFKNGIGKTVQEDIRGYGMVSYILPPDIVEDMYLAFKARLKSEVTCNCWPKEAVPK